MPLARTCLICGKSFNIVPARAKSGRGKYCSKGCKNESQIGRPAWNKGLEMGPSPMRSLIMKEKYINGELEYLKNTQFPKGNTPWAKGKKFGISNWGTNEYRNLHKKVNKLLGKAKSCSKCGSSELNNRFYHWANISGSYSMVASDWINLCVKCHSKMDAQERHRRDETK